MPLCPPAGRLIAVQDVPCKGGLGLNLPREPVSDAWRSVVADDHADGAESLASALATCGCTPCTVGEGLTALALIRQYTRHTALLELTLAQMA